MQNLPFLTCSWSDRRSLGAEPSPHCLTGVSVCVLLQEEYRAEGISWHTIDYIDNSGCINLISKKPTALLHLLDEECKYVSRLVGLRLRGTHAARSGSYGSLSILFVSRSNKIHAGY